MKDAHVSNEKIACVQLVVFVAVIELARAGHGETRLEKVVSMHEVAGLTVEPDAVGVAEHETIGAHGASQAELAEFVNSLAEAAIPGPATVA